MKRAHANGFGLLEVIAAVMVFTISGITVLALVMESIQALRITRQKEASVMVAARLFEAVALWSREDLDRRLGTRVQGQWQMYTERSTPTLYTVELTDTITGGTVLQTELYRPLRPRQAQ